MVFHSYIPASVNDMRKVKVGPLDVERVVIENVVNEGPHPTSNVTDVVTRTEGGIVGNYCGGM